MGQITISITKRAVFRDSVQEWANTYTYRSANANPDEAGALGMIDELVANEKTFHSSAVTFVRARCWSSGGTKQENKTIAMKNLTGTGSSLTVVGFDYERAVLIQWPAGVDSRGRKVYLRKWYHCCGEFAGNTPSADILANRTGWSTTQRTNLANAADVVTRIGNLEAWGLTAESGRERDGGAPIAHKYLEHHQLGDQWRG